MSEVDLREYLTGVLDSVAFLLEDQKSLGVLGNKDVLLDLQKLLANLGVASTIIPSLDNGMLKLSAEDVVISASLFDYRNQDLANFLPNYGSGEWLVNDIQTLNFIQEYKGYQVTVVGVVDGKEVCGDISVPISHTYINEGVINHNTGKSTFALFCMLRKLYELSCYTNIPTLFGLMPTSLISLMYFSVSKTQAELTGFGQLRGIIDTVPYFQESFGRSDRINSMLVFPENLMFLYGSSSGHCLDPQSVIYSNRGLVRAEGLRVGDLVYNGNSLKRVKSVYRTLGLMYKITTDTGKEVIVKDNHKNYTQRGFVETKDLVIGDKFFRINSYENPVDVEECVVIPKFTNDRNPCKKDKWVLDERFDKTLVHYRIGTHWYRTSTFAWTRMGNRYGQASRRKMAEWDNVYRYIRERKDYKLHYKIHYKDRRRPQRIYGCDPMFSRYRRWVHSKTRFK